MKLTSFKVDTFGLSDIGLVRSNNEDVWASVPHKHFFILADGMGGHKAGEVAASIAVESMCASIQALNEEATVEETCLFLRKAIAKANAKVFEQSQKPELAGMGTTLSCFVIKGEFLIYVHIGDSRLYRYRDKLMQLTEDHSLRQLLQPKDSEGASVFYQRNIITRAIGTHPAILPDIGVISLLPQDIYMLCSDGLSDYVDEHKLAQLLSAPLSLEEIGKKMIRAALEKGGNDNITLLLTKFQQ
jgi:serine/threonine protein phosphatase PrpC